MRGRLRDWWPLLVVAVAVAAVVWLLYVVWRSPHRSDLATYGAFAIPVLMLAVGWIVWAWRRARTSTTDSAAADEALDRAADRLAATVEAQWKEAAGKRGLAGADPIRVTWGKPSLPMAGPLAAAIGSTRFDALPGLAPASEALLAAGQISNLHAVYGGLGSGRLVIAGPPGSGKSGAAVLLILAALQHRRQVPAQDRPKVPVPILVTTQDWDPRRQPAADWLISQLRETYPIFTGTAGTATAAALITAGKIAVILDGLDEIVADLRPVALRALSQQASFRLVVLSRTAEMASAASRRGVLQGAAAIELQAIDPAEAASYLERVQLDPPPDGWLDLMDRIRINPTSPMSKALDNPLALTLIRDTYQSGDDARELLEFCDITLHGIPGDQAAQDITDHLLDRVLPAAYAHQPGQPSPYDLPTAQNALTKIAARMNQEGTRDLQWWHIPAWAPPTQRIIVGGMVGALWGWLWGRLEAGFVGQVVFGLFGLVVGGVGSLGGNPPHRIGKLRLRKALNWDNLVIGLVIGFVFGFVFGFVLGLKGALIGVLVGVLGGPMLAVALDADPDGSSLSPATSWRNDLRFALAFGLLGGLAGGLVLGFHNGRRGELVLWLVFGVLFGLATGFVAGFGISTVWPLSFAEVQIAIKWRTPVHLMRFLNDAHDKNVLRTVGPTYQFRHARLQDRLVAAAGEVTTTWDTNSRET